MRTLTRIFLGILLPAAVVVAGPPRADAKDEPRIHVVVIENMRFSPRTIRLREGEQVVFNNRDLFPHTATTKSKEANGFDSGILKPGESWTFTPRRGETIRYACTLHPTMEGEIIVEH